MSTEILAGNKMGKQTLWQLALVEEYRESQRQADEMNAAWRAERVAEATSRLLRVLERLGIPTDDATSQWDGDSWFEEGRPLVEVTVDGITFISHWKDEHGVQVLWPCPTCGARESSGLIPNRCELGAVIAEGPTVCERCERKATTDDPGEPDDSFRSTPAERRFLYAAREVMREWA